jgi:tetratricopeptide (TPR) repeat protein
MAAVAPTYELPPVTADVVTALTLVRDDSAEALAHAEVLVASGKHDDGAFALEELWHNVRSDQALALRQRLALAWAEMYRGNLDHATELLSHAEGIAQSARFEAADRAEVMFRRGAVECQRNHIAEAINLLSRALETNERSPRPRTTLAANAYEWRARCYVGRRDWDAAGRDAECALDLATQARDEPAQARALFQASIVAERRRDWLVARLNAEQALELFRRNGNELASARVLNNLGGIDFLLGDACAAEEHLLSAVAASDACGSAPDLAQSVNSLAQVYLRTGRPAEARARALRATELLDGREDFLDELGNAQLVIARSLMEEGESAAAGDWITAAENTFDAFGSTSHRAAALVARGDLERMLGDADAAADLYRRAAESLQDVHF